MENDRKNLNFLKAYNYSTLFSNQISKSAIVRPFTLFQGNQKKKQSIRPVHNYWYTTMWLVYTDTGCGTIENSCITNNVEKNITNGAY